MSVKTLARSSFLLPALRYIAANPGACKADVIASFGRCPNRTYANRNSALNNLIGSFVRNDGAGRSRPYRLSVTDAGLQALAQLS